MPDTENDADRNNTVSRKKRRFSLREFIFILVILATEIGCNISLDTPGALQNAIIKNYNLSLAQFSLLYSLYFIPTIVLNGFSGFLIDRVMGIKLSTLIYSIIGLIGVTLFAAGGVSNIFWLMLMGRLIFGLGNELATAVCVNYCIFSWYRHTIMNVVSSLSSDGSIAGTLIIYQIGPRLFTYLKQSLPEKESLDIVICLASGLFLITGALAVLMTYLKPKNNNAEEYQSTESSSQTTPNNSERTATLRDVFQFPAVFWLLCLLNGFTCSLISFSQLSQGLLTSSEFDLSVDQASNAVTAMGAVKIAMSLPLSLSVDFVGRNTWYIFVAHVIGTVAYFLFVLRVNPYAGMILSGLSNSVYNAAILPMYAYPIEKHLVGSCYGIMSTMGGLCMFAAPLIVGRLVDSYGYGAAIYFYFVASLLCLICAIVIWLLDKRSTGILSMTPSQRIEHEMKMEKKTRLENSRHHSQDFSSMSYLADSMINLLRNSLPLESVQQSLPNF